MRVLKTSTLLLALLTLLLGIVYPYFIWGFGQIVFHKKANGTLFTHQDGEIMGSEWIGQNFTSDKYFHPRPSAAGDKGYDASNSSGSNLGPTSQKLIDAVKQRVADYREINRVAAEIPVPADAVTASGSGLDPHISQDNARLQASRIADVRHFSLEAVNRLIDQFTEGWISKRVNVLRINLALDEFGAGQKN